MRMPAPLMDLKLGTPSSAGETEFMTAWKHPSGSFLPLTHSEPDLPFRYNNGAGKPGDAHGELAVKVTAYHDCEALRGEGYHPCTCCVPERQRPDPVCMALQPAHAAEGPPRISEKEPNAIVHIPERHQQPVSDQCHTTTCRLGLHLTKL